MIGYFSAHENENETSGEWANIMSHPEFGIFHKNDDSE